MNINALHSKFTQTTLKDLLKDKLVKYYGLILFDELKVNCNVSECVHWIMNV